MRQINRLTARTVQTLTAKGLHADGLGLYLRVDANGSKRWSFIFQWRGSRREMGLGSSLTVSLAEARQLATEARLALKRQKNPIDERRSANTERPPFGEAAEAFVSALESGWRNPKHRQQWRSTLRTYCAPIWQKRVDEITTDDVLRVLKPVWQTKAETAQRLRARIERVLDSAKVQGLRSGENPARWRGHLDTLLPRRKPGERTHFAALPYEQLPSVMSRVASVNAVSARALELLILTAARTGEILGAEWSEIDRPNRLWTIPPERTKTGIVHRVPLTDRCIMVLDAVEGLDSRYIFPGIRPGVPLSNMAMTMLARRLRVEATVHGFRSTFRDWAGDRTDHPREIAEAALGHKVGDDVERAYRRRDALAKRRVLMEEWAAYCYSSDQPQLVAA